VARPKKEVIEPMKRTSLSLPDRLWKAAKIRSVEEGRDFQDLVSEALEDYLRKQRKGGKKNEG
jgi:predicted DNA binding CopG/RHH family protein